jgi:hypothetical protein
MRRLRPQAVDHDRRGGAGRYHLALAAARAAVPVQVAPVPYPVPELTSSLIQKQLPEADSAARTTRCCWW